ncbi:MAG: ECF transporter S component, partial [Oscillospiraceae bacterium]|nr:ECF transporter S component [Oscillospiraceae bacterium]
MENTQKMPVDNIGKKRIDTKRLVQLGMLAALMIVMEFTGIGIIPIGFGFEITILMIPVVIGAMAVGKGGGAILGGVFGLLSLWECFGKSAFGTFLFGINPFATILICLVPRILAGFLSGMVFELLKKHDKTKLLCYGGAALTGSLVTVSNTHLT